MHSQFKNEVWGYYHEHKRIMPWRDILHDTDEQRSYKVLISEVMLQQTQVGRAQEKYNAWMQLWPSNREYQKATLGDTLVMWSGLGYNRRAKYLYQSLHALYEQYNNTLPTETKELCAMPGIGINTANALLAYVYNKPAYFVETNIRTVYLHHFFSDSGVVKDSEILRLVSETLDSNNPREWYWALMDYGSYLKKNRPSILHKSAQHRKQTTFDGSVRQVRGNVIKELAKENIASEAYLNKHIIDKRLKTVLNELVNEGLIVNDTVNKTYRLAD